MADSTCYSKPDPPPVPQPIPPPVLQQNTLAQPPAQIVAGARQNCQNAARQEHPQFPDKIWCTKGKHWVLKTVFGNLLTCNACQATDCARAARLREQRVAQEAPIVAQLQLGDQIGENLPQVNPAQAAPAPAPAPPLDPLSAVSPEDKILLENCRNKLMEIAMESCNL